MFVEFVADQGVESLPGGRRGVDGALDQLWDCRAGRLSGEITGSVSPCGRVDDASGEVGNDGVLRVEVVGAVVVEVELSEGGVGYCLGLVSEEFVSYVRVRGEDEDPQVAFQRDPSLAESELAEPLEVVVDLRRKQTGVAGGEFPQSPLGGAQASDTRGEVVARSR